MPWGGGSEKLEMGSEVFFRTWRMFEVFSEFQLFLTNLNIGMFNKEYLLRTGNKKNPNIGYFICKHARFGYIFSACMLWGRGGDGDGGHSVLQNIFCTHLTS